MKGTKTYHFFQEKGAIFLRKGLLLLFFVYITVIFMLQHVHHIHLQRQLHETQKQIIEARRKNTELRAKVREMNSDAYIEQKAREDLGMIRPGELPFLPIIGK